MRLDLWLKTVGLIKRRAVAKALCDAGRATRNGKIAAPSELLRIGDILDLQFPTRTLQVEVLDVPRGAIAKDKREDTFQIKSEAKHSVHDIVNADVNTEVNTTSSTRSDDDEDGLSGPIF